jgi:hypothetical protein
LIFYTLQGPTSKLEIYDDKIRLLKGAWSQFFSKKESGDNWKINELSYFEITVPKFLFFSGKIEWTTFSGEKGTFRFTTNPQMVKKIEIYLQKRVIKNHQQLSNVKTLPQPRKDHRELLAAA